MIVPRHVDVVAGCPSVPDGATSEGIREAESDTSLGWMEIDVASAVATPVVVQPNGGLGCEQGNEADASHANCCGAPRDRTQLGEGG